jgi:hypothetical protein
VHAPKEPPARSEGGARGLPKPKVSSGANTGPFKVQVQQTFAFPSVLASDRIGSNRSVPSNGGAVMCCCLCRLTKSEGTKYHPLRIRKSRLVSVLVQNADRGMQNAGARRTLSACKRLQPNPDTVNLSRAPNQRYVRESLVDRGSHPVAVSCIKPSPKSLSVRSNVHVTYPG